MKPQTFILLFILSILGIERTDAQCLISSYPLDGNATDITGGNDGTISGATPTDDRFGNANSAYSFDGVDDYITIPHGDFLLNQFTYSLWVKANSLPPSTGPNLDRYRCVLAIGYSAGDQHILLANDAGNGNLGWSGGGYDSNAASDNIDVNASPNISQWYHLAFTRSSTSYKFYVDGVLIGSFQHSGLPAGYGTSPTGLIGKRWNNMQFFDGEIDNVRIFDCALSDSEVTELFNGVSSARTNSFEHLIKAYPNPSSESVIIENPVTTSYNISVVNNLGQVCYTSNSVTGTTSINKSELGTTGLYFLQVRDGENQIITEKKIVLY